MNQNDCLSKKEVAREPGEGLTNTLVDTGQMLIDLENLVEVLGGKLHGTIAEPQDLVSDSAPGILNVADRNFQVIVSIYTRLHELVAKL